MIKIIATLIASVAILSSGYIHGLWTERWGMGEESVHLAARMEKLPQRIGEWEGEDTPQAESILDRQLAGSLQRRYTHVSTGQSVTIAILCGRPGPICIHTPDVCYGASGFAVGKPSAVEIPGEPARFWMANAVRERASETTRLRIFWGWSHTGDWEAVDDPRVSFAGQPALLKMYVLRDLPVGDEKIEGDPCVQFMQAFLSEAKRVLFLPGDSE